jgi:hypothetical protein
LHEPDPLLCTVSWQARDFRNDFQGREACQRDADRFCGGVQPDNGRIHGCLQAHLSDLRQAAGPFKAAADNASVWGNRVSAAQAMFA